MRDFFTERYFPETGKEETTPMYPENICTPKRLVPLRDTTPMYPEGVRILPRKAFPEGILPGDFSVKEKIRIPSG